MTRCARCDWQPDETLDRHDELAELREHALVSGHGMCTVCTRRSLTEHEPRVCEKCLTRAQATLSAIVTMWIELPSHVGHLKGTGYDRSVSHSEDMPLPGGDALAMLSAGSDGAREDAYTFNDKDPSSVAHTLGAWYVTIRRDRGERTPDLSVHSHRAGDIYRAAGYLERHMRWAAVSFNDFPLLTADLEQLHERLAIATGRAEHLRRAGADCFDCGGTIVWRLDPKTGTEIGRDVAGAQALECRRCHATYTVERYTLALKAKREDHHTGWVQISDAAAASYRNVKTIRTWVERDLIASSRWCGTCRQPIPFGPLTRAEAAHPGHRLLIWWPDLHERTTTADHRAPRPRKAS